MNNSDQCRQCIHHTVHVYTYTRLQLMHYITLHYGELSKMPMAEDSCSTWLWSVCMCVECGRRWADSACPHPNKYTHAHTHTYTYTFIHACTHAHIHVHMHKHSYMRAHTHTHIHTCTHAHTFIHACTHAHTYMHAHTNTMHTPALCYCQCRDSPSPQTTPSSGEPCAGQPPPLPHCPPHTGTRSTCRSYHSNIAGPAA